MWRVGNKVGRTLYFCDTLVGMMDTPELARKVVAALNKSSEQTEESSFVPYPAHLPPRYNGSGQPCDMLVGPCSCGAWHDNSAPVSQPVRISD